MLGAALLVLLVIAGYAFLAFAPAEAARLALFLLWVILAGMALVSLGSLVFSLL